MLDELEISVLQVEKERVNRVPDWQALVPFLDPPFNPVFIELVGRKANLVGKRLQLSEALIARGAHIGVLIMLDSVEARVEVERDAAIVELSLRQLEEDPRLLGLLLREARNQLVHGVG